MFEKLSEAILSLKVDYATNGHNSDEDEFSDYADYAENIGVDLVRGNNLRGNNLQGRVTGENGGDSTNRDIDFVGVDSVKGGVEGEDGGHSTNIEELTYVDLGQNEDETFISSSSVQVIRLDSNDEGGIAYGVEASTYNVGNEADEVLEATDDADDDTDLLLNYHINSYDSEDNIVMAVQTTQARECGMMLVTIMGVANALVLKILMMMVMLVADIGIQSG